MCRMDYDLKWTFPSLLSDLDKRDYTFRVHVLVSGPQQVTAISHAFVSTVFGKVSSTCRGGILKK